MSEQALAWAFQFPVTGSRKAVLLALAHAADPAGVGSPTVAEIVLFSGLGDRAVQSTIRGLEQAGIVRVELSRGRAPSVYRLRINPASRDINPASRDINPASHDVAPPAAIEASGDLFGEREKVQVDPPERKKGRGKVERVAKKRTRVPEDWQPDAAGVRFAEDRNVPHLDEVPRFRDFHLAKGSLMESWAAAWRTWCQNHKNFNARRPAAPGRNNTGDHVRRATAVILGVDPPGDDRFGDPPIDIERSEWNYGK